MIHTGAVVYLHADMNTAMLRLVLEAENSGRRGAMIWVELWYPATTYSTFSSCPNGKRTKSYKCITIIKYSSTNYFQEVNDDFCLNNVSQASEAVPALSSRAFSIKTLLCSVWSLIVAEVHLQYHITIGDYRMLHAL